VKKSLKMQKKYEKRLAWFEARMSDARAPMWWKSGAHRPGSNKRK
jgi:hypothetical protein